ncbi:PREDICTED: uncharacterized protein LOC108558844 [Nicrophorus vespilloides]|uniref:Uncharacterized protein LOC108558844 n=1 Tax=Nicrophorus vespilloides TaxID=110193 RepID=A0ABM1M9W4_NICVS|nr:PREDICTED: uncharacterized protein LOC108558844 [Nicrophorus vespilloides]
MASCLSSEDCNVLLNSFNNYRLDNFSLQPFNEELRGYLGEHLLLKLNAKNGGEDKRLTFFVKNSRCEGLCDVFKDTKFFDKEHFVYRFFKAAKSKIPEVNVECIPKLFYTVDEVIVLENLAERKYFGNKSHKFDRNHVLKALESTAKFHSVSIAFEERRSKELGRKYTLDEDYQKYFDPFYNLNTESSGHNFIQSVFYGALTLIDVLYKDKKLAEDFKERLRNFVKDYFDILNKKNNFRKVVAHGDLWGNNILFKYENGVPVKTKLIDFQLFRYAPPAHDVTMLIYMTGTRETIRKHCDEYYSYYYDCLKTELNQLNLDVNLILPISEYEETCKMYMRVAKLTWLAYRETSESKNISEITNKDLESVIIGREDRQKFVKRECEIDESYKKVMEEILEDIRLSLITDILSTEDCYKVIKKRIGTSDYKLVDYRINSLSDSGERGGFLGEHYILTIEIERGTREILDFFVKQSPTTESQKKFAEESGATFKEMQFFKKIIPDSLAFGIKTLEEVAAKCYLSQESMIIVDNLKSLGFKTANFRDGICFEDLKLGVKTIAKMHASGFLLEEKYKEKYGVDIKLNDIYSAEFKEAFYTQQESATNLLQAGVKAIKEQIQMFSNYSTNITPDEFYSIAFNLYSRFEEFCSPSTKYRNTLCHADLWCNNIMLSEDNCILVDFQSYRYYPPAFDLMEHIYLSTLREDRRLYLDKLLDIYYDKFKSIVESYGYPVENLLTRKEFLKSCEEGKRFAALQSVTHRQNVTISSQVMQEIFQREDFLNTLLFVDRSEHVRVQCETDPIYRKIVKDGTDELRELCEKVATENKLSNS